jgi:hypothetical protein
MKKLLYVCEADTELEWRVAGGEWRVASGEWRVASGEWRAIDFLKSNLILGL